MTSANVAIVIFAREPIPGRVKTRLIPALGQQGAARLYEKLLHTTLRSASRLKQARCLLYCDTDHAQAKQCVALADQYAVEFRTQRGASLGERMAKAIREVQVEGRPVVLIGSDCPGYTAEYLQSACDTLAHHAVVLGPAGDGGYVLIGMRELHEALFQHIPWSSGHELNATRQRLTELALDWSELPEQQDIDTESDLVHLPPQLKINKEPADVELAG